LPQRKKATPDKAAFIPNEDKLASVSVFVELLFVSRMGVIVSAVASGMIVVVDHRVLMVMSVLVFVVVLMPVCM
jgi:hypothetical protein